MSTIWNHKTSGILGAAFTALVILCRKLADGFTTFTVSRNLKNCGKGVVVMHGLTYRNPENISLKDKVIVGANGCLTTEFSTGGGI